MIQEFSAFFELFKQGKELANKKTWKNHQLMANSIVAFLTAAIVVAGGFGYKIDIDQVTLQMLAGGIVSAITVFNAVLTAITSAHVGFKNTDAD